MSDVVPFGRSLGYVAAIVLDDGRFSLVDTKSGIRTNHREACADLRYLRERFPTLTSTILVVRGAVHRRRRG